MRIVFMGTPDFAVPSLKKLCEQGHEVTLAVTQEDKPVGRKQILTPPDVKVAAMELGIPVYQPKSLKTEEAYARIAEENPDCIVVAAYGKILPASILNLPKYGCINVHGSLLPKYRGAAPIQWAVINGEPETGITVMQMDEGLDTGDILSVFRRPIPPDATSGEMFDQLAEDGASILCETLPLVEKQEITPRKQEGESNYVSMLDKSISWIHFDKTAHEVHNLVRGLNPWPIACFLWDGKKAKVFKTKEGPATKEAPGTLISGTPLCIACGDGTSLEILEIQPEGGKRLAAGDFWRGHQLPMGTVFESGQPG